MDGLAARGQRWVAARSPAPWTLPAMRAMLSGAWPDDPAAQRPDLGLRLRAAGWTPLAVTTNPWLTAGHGFGDGFAVWENTEGQDAAAQVERALALRAAHADKDVFLLVHVIDPHLPWKEPPHLRLPAEDRPPVDLGDPLTAQRLRAATPRDARGRAALAAWARRRYLQNVAEVDEALGVLVQTLGPTTTLVLAADHGEELLDHGGWDHGRTLYEEQLRVPLLAVGPGLSAAVHTAPVSTRALAATVAVWAGAAPPPGPSLLDGAPERGFPAGWAYGAPAAWGLLQGTRKRWVQGRHFHETDLAEDPQERAPALDAWPDAAFGAALGEALGRPAGPALRVARDAGSAPAPGDPWVLRCARPIASVHAVTAPAAGLRAPEVRQQELRFEAGPTPLATELYIWPDPGPCAWSSGGPAAAGVDLRSVHLPPPIPATAAPPPPDDALRALGYLDAPPPEAAPPAAPPRPR